MSGNKQQMILVVDDSKLIRVEAKNILESLGYGVDTAEGGEAGISKIFEIKPDLVLLDIEMPDINGLEVFKHIRAEDNFQTLPLFIFFTTHIDKKLEGFKLGVSDFISKSLAKSNPEEFHARIHAHLKIAKLIRKNIELEKLNIINSTSTSARHEIFQPLTIINVEISSVLSRKDLIPRCEHCISALTSAKKAATKIKNIVEDFSSIETTETIELSGGGNVLARSQHK